MRMFAQLLESYFQESARAKGIENRHFEIAGRAVDFQFSGNRWTEEMTRAMAHLELSGPSPLADRLTVAMWDGSVEPANHLLRAYLFTLTNWWFDYTGPRGAVLDIDAERMAATYQPGTGTLQVVDLERGAAFYWKRDASPMPYYESCYPFRTLLHSWMRDGERYFIHGAAVGLPEGGVILSGKSGAGKSTSALACFESALKFAGDENCLVQENARGGFDVHSLYCTAKVKQMKDLESFPQMGGKVVNPHREPGDKVAISLDHHRDSKLIGQFPLRAILIPVVTGRLDTQIVACSAQEALMAMAPETLSQLPSSGRQDLKFLGDLARRVPCYRILLGTSLGQVPERILELLQSLGDRGRIGESAVATALP